MTWTEYTAKFEKILTGEFSKAPYDKAEYLEYVKLNNSRVNRWNKKTTLTEDTLAALSNVKTPQKWLLIIEHWCGDAANIAPVLNKIAESSDLIELEIHLRDDGSNLIDQYLTNGGKAIPKLVSRDLDGNDLFVWGPRPAECQAMVMANKDSDMTTEEKKSAIQVWYNKDNGEAIQKEISRLIS